MSLNASLTGFRTLNKPSKAFQRASMTFCLPDDFIILLTNSSIDMVPLLRALFSSFICVTCSCVYPASSSCSAVIFDIFLVSFDTDSVSMSALILPFLRPLIRVFSKVSLSFDILSKFTPWVLETDLIVSIKASSSAMPEPSNCFHPDEKAPVSNSFLDVAESFIIPPTVSDIWVRNSLASSKSPIIISQDWVHPD